MGERVEFAVAIDARPDCVVVRVDGELDMANAGAFEEAVTELNASPHVVVDLSACSFLDSSGMRAIAVAARQAARVSIVATDPGVLRVLEITALDTMVSVYPSLDEALAGTV